MDVRMILRTVTALRGLVFVVSAAGAMSLTMSLLAGHAAAQVGPQAVPVTVGTIGRQDGPNWQRGLVTVQPYDSVQLRPRVDGTLFSVPVQEGQDVKAGDLLAL